MPKRRNISIEEESEKSLNRGIKILENYKSKIEGDRRKRLGETPKKEVSSAKKVFRFFLIIIIVVVVILLLDYGPILGIKILDIGDDPIVIDNILSNESIYLEYNGELLIYTDGVIATYDKSGNKTWEYKLIDGFIPTIYSNR